MKKILGNVILNIAHQILNIIIPLITAPYIARVMTPNEIGIYSYSNSVSGMIAVLMLLGMANYGSRTIAMNASKGECELSKVFWELFSVQLLTSFAGLILFFCVADASDITYKKGLYAQFFYLLAVSLDISWYFTGTGQFRLAVTRGCAIRLLQTAAIFIFIKSPEDILVYILIMSVGTLLGNIVLWVPVFRQISLVKISTYRIISHIRPNFVLFIPLLASSVYVYIDKIMLGMIASSADLGIYEYAEKITKIPLSVIYAIGAVMIPATSKLVADNDLKVYQKLFISSMKYVSLLASAMSFGLLAVAPELVAVYLGPSFSDCVEIIQIMSGIILISSFASVILTQLLMPEQKDKEYIWSVILGASVNLMINGLLIPSLGSLGAAIGTICAEFAVLVGYLIGAGKRLNFLQSFVQWGKSICCGGIMFLVVKSVMGWMESELNRLLIGFTAGVFTFAALTLILLWFEKDGILWRLLRKKRRLDE